MKRRALAALAAAAFALLPLAAPGTGAPDLRSWLADFSQLQDEMADDYANLEWVVADRRIDLTKLVALTDKRLHAAQTDDAAREAFEDFIAAFGDGHLEIVWPVIGINGGAVAKSVPLCKRLGFEAQDLDAGIVFSRVGHYEPYATPASRYFPTGILTFADGTSAGILRLGIFSAYPYPELCEQARAALNLADNAPCDDACESAIDLRTEDELTDQLTTALQVLQTAPRLRAIIVDITGNGGGTDWADAAARELTTKRLRSPALGFVRGEHWTNVLTDRERAVDADLATATGPSRDALLDAQRIYTAAIAASNQPCNRRPLWAGATIACSQIVKGSLFTSGTMPYAPPGSFAGLRAQQYLFAPARFSYHEGVYEGPLIVLVDPDTASSAERFAAMLQDAHAALLVGEPTLGAGCGFTNGGVPATLDHSGAYVRMPDCIQYRENGTDAVAGVTPDVAIPWRDNDSLFQRAARAYETLNAVMGRR